MSHEDELGFAVSGEVTSESWAEKVVRHALSKDPDLDPISLLHYGLDEEQADRIYAKEVGVSSSIPKKSISTMAKKN